MRMRLVAHTTGIAPDGAGPALTSRDVGGG